MKSIQTFSVVIFILASCVAQASDITRTRQMTTQTYQCTFFDGASSIGHGQLFNQRVLSHGSNSFSMGITFDPMTSENIKQQYGPSHYSHSPDGLISGASYEIFGPNEADLSAIGGDHTSTENFRYVGEINSRQDIISDLNLNISQNADASLSIQFQLIDEEFSGTPNPGSDSSLFKPHSARLSGRCN